MNKKPKYGAFAINLKQTGVGYDKRTQTVYRRFQFTDYLGNEVELLFAAGKHKDREGELIRQLENAGCLLPLNRKEIAAIIASLDEQTTTDNFNVVSQFGWLDDEAVFCTPLEVYGSPSVSLETDFSEITADHTFGRKGKLKLWRQLIARMAFGNRVMTFALAAAFAGPLLKPLNVESGGFQLWGDSSTGKTTCLRAAMSVWAGNVVTWNMTINALDQLGSAYSDLLLPLDEVGAAPGGIKQVLDTTYRLCGNGAKRRFTDTNSLRTNRSWFMSTAEKPSTELAQREGVDCDPGQLIRLTDIHADGGKSMGAFENLHSARSPGEFSDRIKAAAQEQYGTAGHAYLKKLIRDMAANHNGLRAWLERRMAFYQQHAPQLGLGGFHERISKRFALVYAAGALAIRYDILPFSRSGLFKAIRYCHSQMEVEALATFTRTAIDAVDLVKKNFKEHEADFLDLKTEVLQKNQGDTDARIGYISYNGGEREYLVELSVFKSFICQGYDWRKVLKDLRARGHINLNKGGKSTVFRTIPTAEGSKRQRVISISEQFLKD